MMKKVVSILMTCVMLITISPVVAADELSVTPTTEDLFAGNSEVFIHNAEKNQLIDELFAQRCKLEVNFEENEAAIREIDYQLADLGVESISYGELLYAMGYDALPAAVIENTDAETQWTSRRLVSTYNGQHYELQIIEGIPLGNESRLRDSKVEVKYKAMRITAGVTEIIKIAGITALGATPIAELADALTLIDLVSNISGTLVENLQPTTVIDAVAGVAYVSLASHIKIILVKPYGSADRSQIWAYIGNYVTYLVSTIIETDSEVGEHGSLPEHEVELNVPASVQSAYFDDYSIALQNYYTYKNKPGVDFTIDYSVLYITLNLLDTQNRFEVPRSQPLITIPSTT